MKSKQFVFFIIIFVLVLSLLAEKPGKKNDTNWPGFRGHMAKGIAEAFPNSHFYWKRLDCDIKKISEVINEEDNDC